MKFILFSLLLFPLLAKSQITYKHDESGNRIIAKLTIEKVSSLKTDTLFLKTSTSEKKEINASVYPNPVNDLLNINLVQSTTLTKITVCDSQGKILISQDTRDNAIIDTKPLAPGIYFVTIENNEQKGIWKIIKN